MSILQVGLPPATPTGATMDLLLMALATGHLSALPLSTSPLDQQGIPSPMNAEDHASDKVTLAAAAGIEEDAKEEILAMLQVHCSNLNT